MKYLITGGCGFIGSHLVEHLLCAPTTEQITIIDNLSSARPDVLNRSNSRLRVIQADLLDAEHIVPEFAGIDIVFHLAANPDARKGINDTRLDLNQETIVTLNVLEAMRLNNVRRIIFSSSGTVYGDVGVIPATETFPSQPISLYGAGKVASEGLITAFCSVFNLSAIIFRFGNVVGEGSTHGVIYDFIRQLKQHPSSLTVLGDGSQAKPYVYVRDLVMALQFGEIVVSLLPLGEFDIFNLAPDGATSVRVIAETLIQQMGCDTQIIYGTEPRGWPGDVPQSRMESAKLKSAGFELQRTSDEAVETAIERMVSEL